MLGKSRTRGSRSNIRGETFRTEMRKKFVTQRIVNLWNSLPQESVLGQFVGIFKREVAVALLAKWIMGCGRESGSGILRVHDQPWSYGMTEKAGRAEWPPPASSFMFL